MAVRCVQSIMKLHAKNTNDLSIQRENLVAFDHELKGLYILIKKKKSLNNIFDW